MFYRADTHVNHDRQLGSLRGSRQSAPVGARVAGFGVAGNKNDAMGMRTMSQRRAQAGQASQTSGDAVDDLHLNACCAQVLHLFTTTAKDERVTPFEAHNMLALAHFGFHQLFNKSLRRALAATAFADINDARLGGSKVHNVLRD